MKRFRKVSTPFSFCLPPPPPPTRASLPGGGGRRDGGRSGFCARGMLFPLPSPPRPPPTRGAVAPPHFSRGALPPAPPEGAHWRATPGRGGGDGAPMKLWHWARAKLDAFCPCTGREQSSTPGQKEAIKDTSGFFDLVPPKMAGGVAGEEQKGEFGMGGAVRTLKRLSRG